jgi:undecaprenyl-diphosphatase
MDWLQVVVLAITQGLTEFLPISSSAHLIMVPVLFNWQDQGLAFDVAVHIGTLIAIVIYFRKELAKISIDGAKSVVARKRVGDSQLAWAILLATAPVGIIGLLLNDVVEMYLRSSLVIASTTILFGVLLWTADLNDEEHTRDEYSLSLKEGLLIGCMQAFALIPGTSRSGVTMTAGLMVGLSRVAAARFSFLLSVPIIFLAGAYKMYGIFIGDISVNLMYLGVGILLSSISAYICIHYFIKFISQIGMLYFVIYRLVLGSILMAIYL